MIMVLGEVCSGTNRIIWLLSEGYIVWLYSSYFFPYPTQVSKLGDKHISFYASDTVLTKN